MNPYLPPCAPQAVPRPEEPRSYFGVVQWWELRRIPYNGIVGVAGLCSYGFLQFAIQGAGALRPGEDLVEPMALIAAVFGMNLCYTAGWITEIVIRWHGDESPVVGPALWKLGTAFSLAVVLLPSVLWGVLWASHNVTQGR